MTYHEISEKYLDISQYEVTITYLLDRWKDQVSRTTETGQEPDYVYLRTAITNAEIAMRRSRNKKEFEPLMKRIMSLCKGQSITPLFDLSGPPMFKPVSVSLSPDQSLLAVLGSNGEVRLFKPDKMMEILAIYGQIGKVVGIAWHPEEALIGIIFDNGYVEIWDLEGISRIYRSKPSLTSRKMQIHNDIKLKNIGFAWSGDGDHLISVVYDERKTLHICIDFHRVEGEWADSKSALGFNHKLVGSYTSPDPNLTPVVAVNKDGSKVAFPLQIESGSGDKKEIMFLPVIVDLSKDSKMEKDPMKDVASVIPTDKGALFISDMIGVEYDWEYGSSRTIPYNGIGKLIGNPNLDASFFWHDSEEIVLRQSRTGTKISHLLMDRDFDISRDVETYDLHFNILSGAIEWKKHYFERRRTDTSLRLGDWNISFSGVSGLIAYRIKKRLENDDLIVEVNRLDGRVSPIHIYHRPPPDPLDWFQEKEGEYTPVIRDGNVLVFHFHKKLGKEEVQLDDGLHAHSISLERFIYGCMKKQDEPWITGPSDLDDVPQPTYNSIRYLLEKDDIHFKNLAIEERTLNIDELLTGKDSVITDSIKIGVDYKSFTVKEGGDGYWLLSDREIHSINIGPDGRIFLTRVDLGKDCEDIGSIWMVDEQDVIYVRKDGILEIRNMETDEFSRYSINHDANILLHLPRFKQMLIQNQDGIQLVDLDGNIITTWQSKIVEAKATRQEKFEMIGNSDFWEVLGSNSKTVQDVDEIVTLSLPHFCVNVDGNELAALSDEYLELWNLETGKRTKRYDFCPDRMEFLSFNSNGRACFNDKTHGKKGSTAPLLLNTAKGIVNKQKTEIYQLEDVSRRIPNKGTHGPTYQQPGRYGVYFDGDNIIVYDNLKNVVVGHLKFPSIPSPLWSPDSRSISFNGQMKVEQKKKNKEEKENEWQSNRSLPLPYIKIIDPETGQQKVTRMEGSPDFSFSGHIGMPFWTQDSSYLLAPVSSSESEKVIIWDTGKGGKKIRSIDGRLHSLGKGWIMIKNLKEDVEKKESLIKIKRVDLNTNFPVTEVLFHRMKYTDMNPYLDGDFSFNTGISEGGTLDTINYPIIASNHSFNKRPAVEWKMDGNAIHMKIHGLMDVDETLEMHVNLGNTLEQDPSPNMIITNRNFIVVSEPDSELKRSRYWGRNTERWANISLGMMSTGEIVKKIRDIRVLIGRFPQSENDLPSLSPSGTHFLYWQGRTLCIMDMDKMELCKELEFDVPNRITWSPSGRFLLLDGKYSDEGRVTLVDLKGEVNPTDLGESDCSFSMMPTFPHREYLYVTGKEVIRVIDLLDGTEINPDRLTGLSSDIFRNMNPPVPFSPVRGNLGGRDIMVTLPGFPRVFPSPDGNSMLVSDEVHFWVISPVKMDWR